MLKFKMSVDIMTPEITMAFTDFRDYLEKAVEAYTGAASVFRIHCCERARGMERKDIYIPASRPEAQIKINQIINGRK